MKIIGCATQIRALEPISKKNQKEIEKSSLTFSSEDAAVRERRRSPCYALPDAR
jgi:hypothetical protein